MSDTGTPTRPDRDPGLAWLVAHALIGAAIGTVAAWVFVPAETDQAVIAIVLPIVAAVSGWFGGREVGAVAAVAGALWFGFAHTEPRFQVEIAARADVILTLAVLVVGVLASELADAHRRLRVQRGDTVKR
jgi:K+-sensing histidine kinase KdpD